MNRSRQFRFVAALIALFGVLFMQLAVASYACPGMTMVQGDAAIAMSTDSADQSMAGCQGMDQAQPSLCHAYGQAGNQSLDKPEIPHAPPFIATGLALEVFPMEATYLPATTPLESIPLTRATAPPLSIRNCCFRI